MAKNQHLLISQHISDQSFPDCTKPRFPGAPTKTLKAATRKILTSKRHTHNHIHECAFLSIQQFIPPFLLLLLLLLLRLLIFFVCYKRSGARGLSEMLAAAEDAHIQRGARGREAERWVRSSSTKNAPPDVRCRPSSSRLRAERCFCFWPIVCSENEFFW